MVGILLVAIISLTFSADGVRYVVVEGKVRGKKLTVYGTDGDLEVERLDVNVGYRGDTMVVEIRGESGLVIGGAGALLGLPPRLINLNLYASASNIFLDLKKLSFSNIFIHSTGSSISFSDRSGFLKLCDTLIVESSLSKIEFSGAGARSVSLVIFDFKSTISRFNFFDIRWKNIRLYARFSKFHFTGLFPGIKTYGILNFVSGKKGGVNPIELIGNINWIKIR